MTTVVEPQEEVQPEETRDIARTIVTIELSFVMDGPSRQNLANLNPVIAEYLKPLFENFPFGKGVNLLVGHPQLQRICGGCGHTVEDGTWTTRVEVQQRELAVTKELNPTRDPCWELPLCSCGNSLRRSQKTENSAEQGTQS